MFKSLYNKQKQIITLIAIVTAFSFIPNTKGSITTEKLPDNKVYSDFVVGPGQIELSIDPGQTKTVEIIISNRLGVDKVFSIAKEDMAGSQDINQTTILLGNDRGPYSLKDYINPAVTSIPIKHGERVRIPITINIPNNAQPGGLYGSLVVSTITDQNLTDNKEGAIPNNALITRIGVLFFIRINGEVKEDGKTTQFATVNNQKYFFQPKPILFNIIYKNDGNVSLKPSGTITIKNSIGTIIDTIKVDPWFALPQSLRFRQVYWQPDFRLGKYTAYASIDRGYNNEKDELNITFWIIPIKIIVGFLALIIAVLVAVRLVFKN